MATNFSQSSIKEELIKKLLQLENWKTKILDVSIYSRILSVMAFALEKIALYGEILFKHSNWKTSTIRKFLIPQASILSYTPYRKKGSFGAVKLSADSTFAVASSSYTENTAIINKWDFFNDIRGELFVYAVDDYLYLKDTTIINTTIDASSSAVDLANNTVGIPVTAHGMPVGQMVSIRDSVYYDGNYTILSTTTTNQIVIEAPYVAETFDGTESIYTGHLYVNVKEGVPKEYTYKASGTANEVIELFDDSIDNDEIDIYIVDVDGEILHEVSVVTDPFLINDIDNYSCVVENKTDFSGINIIFGEDIYTRQLVPNEYVLIKYATTSGSSGEIIELNKINTIGSSILTSTGEVANLYVTNDESISGGTDYESLDSIKSNGRNLFGAGYRAGSKNDWLTIIKSHPSVYKATIWTEYDINKVEVSINQNLVYLSAISTAGEDLTVTEKSDISLNYLKDLRPITDVVQWQNLQVINIRLNLTAKIKLVTEDEVKNDVYTILNSNYGILNAEYKTNVYDSDLKAQIQNLDNIIYIVDEDTAIYHSEKSEVYNAIDAALTSHEVVVSLPAVEESNPDNQILLTSGSVEVWIKRKISGTVYDEKQIAQCNSGTPTVLEGINGFNVAGGVVSYVSNIVSYNITDIILDSVPPPEIDGSTYGYQEWSFTAPTTTASASGLNNDATVYNCTITVDGTPKAIAITGSAAQTIQTVIDEINSDLGASAVAGFNASGGGGNGSIKVTSATYGTSSSVLITDTDLFSNITNADASPDTAVAGTAPGTFGVINPSESDSNGYWLRLVYRTENGNGDFTEDIRLPYFYNITNIQEDDIFYTLSYIEE